MDNILLINGSIPEKGDLLRVLWCQSLFRGKTPFTSCLIINGKIPFWEKHKVRLELNFKFLYEQHSLSEFLEKVEKSLSKIRSVSGTHYLRFTMLESEENIELLIHCTEYSLVKNDAISLKLANFPNRSEKLPSFLKFGNYLEVFEAVKKIKNDGFDDLLFTSSEGHITECSTSNIFFRKGEDFYGPPLKLPLLDGVTREIVIDIISRLNLRFNDAFFKVEDLREIDEVFVTNSLKGLVRVKNIESIEFNSSSHLYELINVEYHRRLGYE